MIKDETNKLDLNQSYYVKSNNEFISDHIMDNNYFDLNKVVIVNALSNNLKPLLLPKYRDSNKRELKKIGLYPEINVGKSKFLKFLIDREVKDCKVLFFGLTGLHFEAVSFLNEYMISISKEKNLTCILIDYDSKYSETTVNPLIEE